jgi:hypothetical protein
MKRLASRFRHLYVQHLLAEAGEVKASANSPYNQQKVDHTQLKLREAVPELEDFDECYQGRSSGQRGYRPSAHGDGHARIGVFVGQLEGGHYQGLTTDRISFAPDWEEQYAQHR